MSLDIPALGTPGPTYATKINDLLARLRDGRYIDAYTHGAVGDGTEKTAQLQAALNAAKPSEGGPGVCWLGRGHHKFEQLVIPNGVHAFGAGPGGYGTLFGHSYASGHSATMLEQVSGVNDDAIIFEAEADFDAFDYQFIGPGGLADFVLVGNSAATAGHGICVRSESKNGMPNEFLWFKRVFVGGFAENGFDFPDGAVPLHVEDCDSYFNAGYGLHLKNVYNVQGVYIEHFSGDGNNEALLHFEDLNANASVNLNNIKSEMRSNPYRGDGGVQHHALIFEDCDNTAVTINGITHISAEPSGMSFLAPEAAISIEASAPTKVPKIQWAGVAVRIHAGGEIGGPGPVLEDTANSITVPNGAAMGTYGYGITVSHPRPNNSADNHLVLGNDGVWAGPSSLAGPGFEAKGATPVYAWYETDGAADQKAVLAVLSGGNWSLRQYTDAGALIRNAIRVLSTGTVEFAGALTVGGAVANFNKLWVPLGGLLATAGSPALGTVGGGRRVAALFDGAADETMTGTFIVPSGWQTFSVEVYWCNAGAGTGTVVWLFQGEDWVEGDTLNVADSQNAGGSEAAGSQDVLVVTPISGSFTAAENRPFTFRIGRRAAADASDTLTNDAGLLGLRLTRVT